MCFPNCLGSLWRVKGEKGKGGKGGGVGWVEAEHRVEVCEQEELCFLIISLHAFYLISVKWQLSVAPLTPAPRRLEKDVTRPP